jgi:hypothetical protein
VQELQRQRVVPSPEEIKDAKLNKSVLEDLRSVISSEKRKRNDKSRKIIDVVTASVSGSSVKANTLMKTRHNVVFNVTKRVTNTICLSFIYRSYSGKGNAQQ